MASPRFRLVIYALWHLSFCISSVLSSMGSTRREGDTSQLYNTSIRSADIILPSRTNTPAPVPVSAMSHPTRHSLKDTTLETMEYGAATLVSNLCPTLRPNNPNPVADYPRPIQPIHHSRHDHTTLHPRQTQLCASPTTPPGFPMHNAFQTGHDQSPPCLNTGSQNSQFLT